MVSIVSADLVERNGHVRHVGRRVGSRQDHDPVDTELRVLIGNRSVERAGRDDRQLQRSELGRAADLCRFLGDDIEDVACPVDGGVVREPALAPCGWHGVAPGR